MEDSRNLVHADGESPDVALAWLTEQVEKECDTACSVWMLPFERTREVTRLLDGPPGPTTPTAFEFEVVHVNIEDSSRGRRAAIGVSCSAGESVCCPG